jgi:hypothetical protein
MPGVGGPWAAIWQAGLTLKAPVIPQSAAPLAEMTLCLEFTLPALPPRGPLRLWHGAADTDRAVGLYVLPDGALRLVHGEIDLMTPADFSRAGETVSLRYRTCARGRRDIADFVNHDRTQRHRVRAALAHAARRDEMMPRDAGFLRSCHVAAIAEFGLAASDIPGLGAGTMVATPHGPVAVERLREGDEILTLGGDALPLRWVAPRVRLFLGRQAPVVLRAPYFGLDHDICVTPETRVMRSGPVVEYLFGEDGCWCGPITWHLARARRATGGALCRPFTI